MDDNKRRKMNEEPAHGELIVIGAEGKTGEIPKQMVIRAEGPFHEHEEEASSEKKSLARCPTYGNGLVCHSAGPVGMWCARCGGEHLVVFVREMDLEHRRRRIVDAEKLAGLLGLWLKEKVMIDQKFSWITMPSLLMRRSHIACLMNRKHQAQITQEVNAMADKLFVQHRLASRSVLDEMRSQCTRMRSASDQREAVLTARTVVREKFICKRAHFF